MSQPGLLGRSGKIGLGVVMSVIASMVIATIGASLAHAQVPPPPGCDLQITKTMSPTPLMSTQPATVTLTVANAGTAPCVGLSQFPNPIPGFPLFFGGTTVGDTKPAGLTFTGPPVATPATGWSCSLPSGNASCFNLAPLAPGYTATFTIPATVTAQPGATVTNCGQTSNISDTNTANNQSCVTNQVVAGPPPPTCDLKITKDMTPNPLVSGQPATVTLTVVNAGTGPCLGQSQFPNPLLFFPPLTFGGTFLGDNKPSGLTFTSPPVATPAAGWSCSLPSGNASCANLAPLPPGYTVTFTINATVTAPPGTTVTNCAQITNIFDTNTANNQSCVTKQVV